MLQVMFFFNNVMNNCFFLKEKGKGLDFFVHLRLLTLDATNPENDYLPRAFWNMLNAYREDGTTVECKVVVR